MRIRKLTEVFFSATGTTRRIIKDVGEGLGIEKRREVDLTRPGVRAELDLSFDRDELIVVGAPVYAGKIPDFIIPVLARLKGAGQYAAAISVYGNVGEGTALSQLGELLENRGFRVIGAASFIGEHSFSTPEFSVAAGRPDRNDREKARAFGENLKKKLACLPDGGFPDSGEMEWSLPGEVKGIIDVIRSHNPGGQDRKKAFISRLFELLPMPQYGSKRFIKKPDVNPGRCTHCKNCARLCPVGAVDTANLKIDDEVCIRCMSCVKNCPVNAREIVYSKPVIIKGFFKLNNTDCRRKPRYYL